MLVWWQKSRYKINYSHFFWGVWHGVLQWCNVRAHKIIISACTHWLSTYHNIPVHVSCLAAAKFDLFLRCVWCIILLEKGKHCGVFRGEGYNASDTYLFPLVLVFVCNLSKPNLVLWCTTMSWNVMWKKMGFYLQSQGHSVGLYNQNMTVSTIIS